jgi:four helix bundle protein
VGVRRFTQLRAWQACRAYKKAIYRLCESGPLSKDWDRRSQLEESVKGPPGHIAEGYGRFNPPDFARFVVIARSSLMESQNHLLDLVDRGYITEETRLEHYSLAEAALQEVTGLMEYLQSPEALRNSRRARERRIASRPERLSRRTRNKEQPEPKPEPSTEPEPEHEPSSENVEE